MKCYLSYCRYGKWRSIFPSNLDVIHHMFLVLGNGVNYNEFEHLFTFKGHKFLSLSKPVNLSCYQFYPYDNEAPVFKLESQIKRKSLRREFSYALDYLIECIKINGSNDWIDHLDELIEVSNKLKH